MKNLAKAVIKVMQAVQGMEKNSRVGSGSMAYDGTKDADVKEVFNKAMAEQGLCILPIGIQDDVTVSRWEETYNNRSKQKQSVFTKVITKYLLLHESGESVELSGYGHGVDSQDKGAGKATTYALKNCLLLMGLTPVGKMPDAETTHSDDIPIPSKQTKKSTYTIEQIKPIVNNHPEIKTLISSLRLRTSAIIKIWEDNNGSLMKIAQELQKMKEGK